MTSLVLRPYQREAVDAVLAFWRKGGGNPLVELPTGAGKTAVICDLVRTLCQGHGTRVLGLAHRKELIEQTSATLQRVWPGASVGVYAASLARKQVRQITFAQVQSVFRKARDLGHVDVVIVDEAHLTPPDGEGQYQTLLAGLRETNPDLRIFGLTATPYRLGQGCLTWGDDRIFDAIVYRADVKKLIADGYLCPLVSQHVAHEIDVSGVKVARGEFVTSQLEHAACDETSIDAVAGDVVAALEERTSALVFATGVTHAAKLRDAIQAKGIACETITGATDTRERERLIDRFRRRQLACITNADVLTTGFDATCVDVLAIARPTMSPGLWVQICGRGMRLDDGKKDCRVLDYGGNVDRHGPIDQIKMPTMRAAGKGEAPKKSCPSCMAEAHASATICEECDFEFPPPERRVSTKASTRAPISGDERDAPSVLVVTDVTYQEHVSKAGSTTMRVDYTLATGGLPVSEWVCLEHDPESFAWRKAAGWWVKAGGKRPAPESIAEALSRIGELQKPVEITIFPEGKYTRVQSIKWMEKGDEPPPPPPEMMASSWFEDEDIPF